MGKKKTHEEYVKELEIKNPNIEVLDIYIDASTPIFHQCKKCGRKWKIKPNHTLSGHGCKMCSERINGDIKKKNICTYKKQLESTNPNVELVGEYINDHTKTKHRCKICGHIWDLDPNHALRGKACPVCNQSHGEKTIQKWLNDKNILYYSQHKFVNCKDKRALPFDFYLPDYNICIEYDGKQHYEPINWFGGIEAFEVRKSHDEIKEKYCRDNNMQLVRISYLQNIRKELEKILPI